MTNRRPSTPRQAPDRPYSLVAELAGDRAAAADVQLILPETGVCSLDRSPTPSAVSELVTVPDAAAACCN